MVFTTLIFITRFNFKRRTKGAASEGDGWSELDQVRWRAGLRLTRVQAEDVRCHRRCGFLLFGASEGKFTDFVYIVFVT
jgi:hypothetical protein